MTRLFFLFPLLAALFAIRVSATGGEPLGYRVTNNKGLEKTVPADKTKLVLRKVKPGKYKFRIVAENEAGTSRPAKLKLRIR